MTPATAVALHFIMAFWVFSGPANDKAEWKLDATQYVAQCESPKAEAPKTVGSRTYTCVELTPPK